MRIAARAWALGKKTTLIAIAFVLAVSTLTAAVPFILSQRAGAAGTIQVASWGELQAELANPDGAAHITLTQDISVNANNYYVPTDTVTGREDTLVINRPVIIDGQDKTIRIVGDAAGWQANYVVQVYNTTNVTLHSVRLTGGDAGLLVNGSEVTLTGNNHVSGNGFGGIELSKGAGVTRTPSITMPSGQQYGLWNDSESLFKPTLWVDGTDATVSVDGLYKAAFADGSKQPYYRDFGLSANVLTAPQPTGPQNGGTQWNQKTAQFTWNAVTNATSYEVRYSQSPAREGGANDGELNGDDATTAAAVMGTTQALELPSYGTWFWQVRAINGNVKSDWSNIWGFQLSARMVMINSATVNGDKLSLSATATDTVSGITSAKVELFTTTGEYVGTIGNGETYSDSASEKTISISDFDLDSILDENGTYIVNVEFTDNEGTNFFDTVEITVSVDRDGPIVAISSISTTDTTPLLTGTVDDADPNTTVVVSIDGEEFTATNNGDGTWSYQVLTPLVLGSYEISATAKDSRGNVSGVESGTLTIFALTPPTVAEPVVNETPTDTETQSQDTSTANLPSAFGPAANLAVLGTTTDIPAGDAEDTDQDVQGATTDDIIAQALDATNNTDGSVLGLAWYWWLAIIGGAAVIIWGVASAIRGRQS